MSGKIHESALSSAQFFKAQAPDSRESFLAVAWIAFRIGRMRCSPSFALQNVDVLAEPARSQELGGVRERLRYAHT